jgi:hypothetical protein
LNQPPATNSRMNTRGKATASSKTSEKRKRDGQGGGQVVNMMPQFLELKEKQAESEAEERARSSGNVDDFPISVCIGVVDEMEDLSDDEKVDVYGVLKDAQNQAIFMSAKEATRLRWLRKEIGRT